jgi:hypothetical protein
VPSTASFASASSISPTCGWSIRIDRLWIGFTSCRASLAELLAAE